MSLLLRGLRRCRPAIARAVADALGVQMGQFFTSSMSEDSHDTEETLMSSAAVADDPYMSFEEVADLARMKPKTLRHYRATGKGPDFFRMGRRLKIRSSKAHAWVQAYENGLIEQPETTP